MRSHGRSRENAVGNIDSGENILSQTRADHHKMAAGLAMDGKLVAFFASSQFGEHPRGYVGVGDLSAKQNGGLDPKEWSGPHRSRSGSRSGDGDFMVHRPAMQVNQKQCAVWPSI